VNDLGQFPHRGVTPHCPFGVPGELQQGLGNSGKKKETTGPVDLSAKMM